MTLKALAQSLGITLKYLFSKPVTVPYPDAPVALKPRFHGRHVLTRHPNGLEKCIGCSLCAAACPAYAIYVEPAENDPENPVSAGERYAKVYEINMLRCIFCGLCEEACPRGPSSWGTTLRWRTTSTPTSSTARRTCWWTWWAPSPSAARPSGRASP